MEHPDWPAFLAAIVADPDDDTTRLAAADFLEENGDADRAAFIRIQVELARLEATGEGKSLEADHLRAKERAFLGPLSMFRQLWAAEACPELVRVVSRGGGRDPLEGMRVEGVERLTWRRGFVDAVKCPARAWFRPGEAIRERQPIQHVWLTQCGFVTRDEWYAAIPGLKGLRLVEIEDADPGFAAWLETWLPGTEVAEVPE
jgi:uncharacterized protein (TIGR02996 family)